jgi:hypothetical protein
MVIGIQHMTKTLQLKLRLIKLRQKVLPYFLKTNNNGQSCILQIIHVKYVMHVYHNKRMPHIFTTNDDENTYKYHPKYNYFSFVDIYIY